MTRFDIAIAAEEDHTFTAALFSIDDDGDSSDALHVGTGPDPLTAVQDLLINASTARIDGFVAPAPARVSGDVEITMHEEISTTYYVDADWLAEHGLPIDAAALEHAYQYGEDDDDIDDRLFEAVDAIAVQHTSIIVAERDFTFK